jgi:hypothetical protein
MISITKQLSLSMCVLLSLTTNIVLAGPKIVELDPDSNFDSGSKIIELHPDFKPKYNPILILKESRPLSYKEGYSKYVSHYTLSNGEVIRHCLKIPMKYRTFDNQHTHLRCADGVDYYVK